jgi:tetratricopeptide (TPR) repeat protein/predicted amidohydrolase
LPLYNTGHNLVTKQRKQAEITTFQALFKKAKALEELDRNHEALQTYEEAIKIISDIEAIWLNKGYVLSKLGRNEEALKSYEKAIEINPTDGIAWYNKGNALRRLGRDNDSLLAYEKSIEINPDDSDVWYNRGVALGEIGFNEEAIESFKKALQINPMDVESWHNQGVALAHLGRNKEALEAYEQAIKIDINHDSSWFGKGAALGNLGRNKAAVRALQRSIELNPNEESRWFDKGFALEALGDFSGAIAAFEESIKINPTDFVVWYKKGVILSKLSRYAEALEALNRAIEINPTAHMVLYEKGLVLDKLSKSDEAIDCLKKAYVLKENSPNITFKYSSNSAKGEKPQLIDKGSTQTRWVRVALVQIDFQLDYDKPPKKFGYSLCKQAMVKKKVLHCLDLAKKEGVNVIVFPELSTEEKWISEITKKCPNMIIIFGSYYKDTYNECPVIINGVVHPIKKIHPSPHHEKPVAAGRCMTSGKDRFIFQTRYGKFIVLICQDFYEEIYRLLSSSDDVCSNLDYVIVPSYNGAVEKYQTRAEQVCQDNNYPFILIANSTMAQEEKAGGTCIIGTDHYGALKRYLDESLRNPDSIKYKMLEANAEQLIIADIDIQTKGIPVPARDFKLQNAKIINL